MRSFFLVALLHFSFSLVSERAVARGVCVRVNETQSRLSLKTPSASKKARTVSQEAPKFSKFTPLEWSGKREGQWLEVQTMDGKTAWVKRFDVSTSMKCLSVRVEKSRTLRGPGDKYEKIEIAQKGDSYLDLGGEDGWVMVLSPKGTRAWINLDHIWRPVQKIRMSFTKDP